MSTASPRASRATVSSVRSVSYATSPLLASKTPPWRSRFVLLLVALAFAVLLGRALYVQVVATEFYQAKGEEKFLHREVLAAHRGRILDRNGLLLATSVELPTVQVDTKLFVASSAQRAHIARLLGLSAQEFNDRFVGAPPTLVLRRHLEEPVWQALQAYCQEQKIRGVHALREFKRHYPEGEAAAHVVGFTGVEDQGMAGAELAFDKLLVGNNGARTVVRDRMGRVVESAGEPRPPDHGDDLVLSIDSRVQSYAYQRLREAVREHGASNGSVVVLDSTTGEVLALANYPGFDPAARASRTGSKLRNIALTDTFEPGSTMKPFIAAMALDSGRWTPASLVDTAPGKITITGATIEDTKPHGTLTLAQVIQKSSNVGTVKIAQQMPARDMWALYTAVGMGQRPRIDFPGAASGRLRPYKTWRPIEHATMSYGYGLSASLLQVARAYTVFARNGDIVPTTLLRADPAAGPVAGQQVISPETARQVREMLHLAASPGGTAPVAQERTLGYTVGGKTGTARVHANGGYTGKHRAFFAGLAPVGSPRIVVAVMLSEPSKGRYYAGEVAAPLFAQVTQQTLRLLNVATDLDVQAQITAPPAVAERESF